MPLLRDSINTLQPGDTSCCEAQSACAEHVSLGWLLPLPSTPTVTKHGAQPLVSDAALDGDSAARTRPGVPQSLIPANHLPVCQNSKPAPFGSQNRGRLSHST